MDASIKTVRSLSGSTQEAASMDAASGRPKIDDRRNSKLVGFKMPKLKPKSAQTKNSIGFMFCAFGLGTFLCKIVILKANVHT